MSRVENLVRQALLDQVADPPALSEPADRAIRGARRIQRRRSVAGVLAGGMALAVTLSVVGYLRGPAPAPVDRDPGGSAGPPAATPAGFAALVGRRALLLADGRTLPLPFTTNGDELVTAYQTPDGFLVNTRRTYLGPVTVWLVGFDGSVRQLLTGLDAPAAVAGDGRRLAWRGGDTLYTGRVAATGTVVTERTSPAPARGEPDHVSGSTVVLTDPETRAWDVWLPDQGDYRAGWDRTAHVRGVYGFAPDGSVLGLVRGPGDGQETCLARLDPTDRLRTTATACGLGPITHSVGGLSPDGRWLTCATDDRRIALVDLTEVFRRPEVAQTWFADPPTIWLDATSVVALGRDGRPGRFRVDQSQPRPYPVAGWPDGGDVMLVPRLG